MSELAVKADINTFLVRLTAYTEMMAEAIENTHDVEYSKRMLKSARFNLQSLRKEIENDKE